MSNAAFEVNFDAIVGPTHNYAGLAWGNLASKKFAQSTSHPKQAALEGLAKMKLLADLGVKQAVLPPQHRPDVNMLRRLGFSGSDAQVLQQARRDNPVLLAACASASSMWAANAATISPSADTADGRVHITAANLVSQLHRSMEAPQTARILLALFPDTTRFAHHSPLPSGLHFCDEGAANHMRLCASHGDRGLEIFVYGREAVDEQQTPLRFPARQTREASAAIIRLHRLDAASFVRQSPHAINAGVFHNDVVAVANENVLLCHESAFDDQNVILEETRASFSRIADAKLHIIQVAENQLPVNEAVQSYLFNSQIVTLPDGSMTMIAPAECREHTATHGFLKSLPARGTPIKSVQYVDVRQSMRNGGGPACLRLRVVLTPAELTAMHQDVLLTPTLYDTLVGWVTRHYRESLAPDDLADPRLLNESQSALDELTRILNLPAIYPFQK